MRLGVLGIALLATALSGCWVLDELESGNKKIEMYTGQGKKDAEEAEATAAKPAAKQPRIGEYFANQKNARTLTPGQVSTDIVSCKLDGGVQFMKETECRGRGGVPKS